jgi:diguanylate cyclase (GGDEF)-like protein/PAS domain S-box-containing protein
MVMTAFDRLPQLHHQLFLILSEALEIYNQRPFYVALTHRLTDWLLGLTECLTVPSACKRWGKHVGQELTYLCNNYYPVMDRLTDALSQYSLNGHLSAETKNSLMHFMLGITAGFHHAKRLAPHVRRKPTTWYQTFLNHTPFLVQRVGEDGTILSVNQRWSDCLGYAPSEATQLTFRDIVDSSCLPFCEQVFRRAFLERQVETVETIFRKKDGTRLWVTGSIRCQLRQGHPPITYGIFYDVSEHHHKTEALVANETKWRHFIDHIPAAVAMLDTNLCYLAVSRRWITDYHLEATSVVGRHHYEVFPEIPAHWRTIHRECLTGKIASREAERFRRADGREEWLRWEVRPWYEESGAIGGLMFLTEVLTPQKTMERDLQATEARFQALVEHVPVGIFLTDPTGACTFVNHPWERLSGMPMSTALGTGWTEAIDPRDRSLVFSSWNQAAKTHTPFQQEYRFQTSSGVVHWVLGRAAPFYDEAGQVVGYLGSVTDITPQKEAEVHQTHVREQLRYQAALLHAQLEASADGILVVNRQRDWILFNRRFTQMWGLEPIDRPRSSTQDLPLMLAQVVDSEAFVEKIDALYANPARTEWDDIELKDGRTFQRYSATVGGNGSDYYGRIWFYRDISVRRRAEMERDHLTRSLAAELGYTTTLQHLSVLATQTETEAEFLHKTLQLLVDTAIAPYMAITLNDSDTFYEFHALPFTNTNDAWHQQLRLQEAQMPHPLSPYHYIRTPGAPKAVDGVREAYLIPLVYLEQRLGVMFAVQWEAEATFSERETVFLSAVAHSVASGISTLRSVAQLRSFATIDTLTGIFTRRYFLERAEGLVRAARQQNQPLYLALFDIDYFKKVNDHYGHIAGDQVLQFVAHTCLTHLQPDEIAGRYGGEEFVLLWKHKSPAHARYRAEQLRLAIAAAQPPIIPCAVTISMGLVPFTQETTLQEALIIADAALYRAKAQGRNQIQF